MRRQQKRRSFAQLLALVLSATVVGFLACRLFCLYQFPSEPPSSAVRWRLFGEAFINDCEPDVQPSWRSSETVVEDVNYIAESSGDERVKELLRGLQALSVSCYVHPQHLRELLEEKYAAFLKVLSIYSAFHVQERDGDGTRRLIWICDVYKACGGLADRIKGVTYALILAMLSRRVLLLDWRDSHFGEQDYLQPNVIDWRLSEKEKTQAYYSPEEEEDKYYYNDNETDTIPDAADSHHTQEPSYSKPVPFHIFSVLGGVDISADILQVGMEAVEGKWQWVLLASNMEPSSLTNDNLTASAEWIKQGMTALGLAKLEPQDIDGLVGLVFRYLFKFSKEIPKEVSTARGILGLEGRTYVGVHVRTGFAGSLQQESVKHPKLLKSPSQWDRIIRCAHHHAAEELGSQGLLFLATDSNLVKNRTLDVHRFQGRFRSLDNSVLHLDRLEKSPHAAEDFEVEGVLSAWVDLILLAESHSLVHGTSGFSDLAQHLCFMPRTKVINGLECSP